MIIRACDREINYCVLIKVYDSETMYTLQKRYWYWDVATLIRKGTLAQELEKGYRLLESRVALQK
jgi:hypothetical protein